MNTEGFTLRAEVKSVPKTAPAVKPHNKWVEPICFVVILLLLNYAFASQMGLANMLNTMMNTAYQLLLKTAFYIMAIAVIMSAFSALLTEFGVTELVNHILSPLMRPLYGLPGAAALGIVTTYLSDNPAILALADDRGFRKYFKKYQLPALTNIGTAFGMGLIVTTFMIGLSSKAGTSLGKAALIGNLGAVVGSIVSTRLMLHHTKKLYGVETPANPVREAAGDEPQKKKEHKKLGERILTAALNGGKTGVDLGLAIIPGILIICTLVLMLTNGAFQVRLYRRGVSGDRPAALPGSQNRLSAQTAFRVHQQQLHCGSHYCAGFCRRGHRSDSLAAEKRFRQRPRHRGVYRNVHVLERLSVHPCFHDGRIGLQ